MNIDKKVDKTNLVLFIGLGLIAISYFFVLTFFRYDDTVSFTAWSVTFWDSLFSGNLGQYFTYAMNNYRGAMHSAYHVSYITFFPWIIWNFPLWLLHPLSKNADVTGMKCVIWSKLFLILCLVVLCIFVYKMLMQLSENDFTFSLAGVVIVAASLEMLDAIAYAGQDEIVYITTLIISMYQYIHGKKRSGLVLAVLSVTFSPIMIIPVLVMFFLMEKRIWKLAIDSVICFLPTLLFSFAYRNDAAFQLGKSSLNTIGTFQTMMNTGTVGTTIGPTSIAFTVLIILLFMAYMDKSYTESKAESMIYYVAISFFALDFLTFSMWYRYCLYVPFFVLMVGASKENRNIKVFLLELILVARFIASLANFYNYSYEFISNIGKRFFGESSGTVIDASSLTYDNLFYLIRPAVLASALILLVICNKRYKKELKFPVSWKVVACISSCAGIVWSLVILKNM